MAPVIGIVVCYNFQYYEYAIKEHGAEVKELIIGDDPYNAKFDGLLLPGGGDIDPEIYGEEQYHKTKNVNRAKDDFEISLFNNAIENDIPVLGICRGIQIMNIAMGGSLYQDIEDLYPQPTCKHDGKPDDDWHKITIEPESLLKEIVGTNVDNVNSAHHQAIKSIGNGLVVTARSKEDGIIEAMEYPKYPFVIGVQYHPERMGKNKKKPYPNGEFLEHATKLFKAFIKAALIKSTY